MMNFDILKNKNFIIIGVILVIVFTLLFLIFSNKNKTYVKDYNDNIENVETIMADDILEAKPVIDDLMYRYNNEEYKYIYNKLFDTSIQKSYSIIEFKERLNNIHEFFGNFVSYDIENARIEIEKKKFETTYIFDMPADFEETKKATMNIVLHKYMNNDIKIYNFGVK